jgi:hypothetical protein
MNHRRHDVSAAILLSLLALSCMSGCSSGQRKGDPAEVGAARGTGNPTGGSAGEGVACGPRTCPAGQVCCNRSCGICTPPDGVCTQQFCESNDAAPGGAPMNPCMPGGGNMDPGAACSKDADCRTFSDYCTGCDCRVLGKQEKDPTCSGPGVRCLADPCRDRAAACQDGHCVLKTVRQ